MKKIIVSIILSTLFCVANAQDSLIISKSSLTWRNANFSKSISPISSVNYKRYSGQFIIIGYGGENIGFYEGDVEYISNYGNAYNHYEGDSIEALLLYAMADSLNSGGGSTDTTSLSNRINLKLDKSDTTNYLGLNRTSNTIEGGIKFGSATGTGRINLPDAGTTAADGIQFGSDVTLYRSGTNILKTNRAFEIGSPYYLATQNIQSPNYNSAIGFIGLTAINLTPNTLTGSSATSALSISQTWNTTGNPPLIFANVTNTASGASASLMDLQVGGVSMFKVSKSGGVQAPVINATQYYSINNLVIGNGGLNRMYVLNSNNSNISIHSSGVAFSSSGYATPNTSSVVDIQSTTQGFLPPRMTTAQINAISSPAEGLVVFNTTISHLCVYQGGIWVKLSHSPM